MVNNLSIIQFQTAETGLALYLGMGSWRFLPTDAGSIWQSGDGGISWTKKLDEGYCAVAASVEGLAVAVGREARVAVSRDGGTRWAEQTLDPVAPLIAVAVAGSSLIAVASDQGALHLSDDGGQSWHACSVPNRGFRIADLAFGEGGTLWVLQQPKENDVRTAAYHRSLDRRATTTSDFTIEGDWTAAEEELGAMCLNCSIDGGAHWTTSTDLKRIDRYKIMGSGDTVTLAVDGQAVRASLKDKVIECEPVWKSQGWVIDAAVDRSILMGASRLSHGMGIYDPVAGSWCEGVLGDNGVIDGWVLDRKHAWAILGSYGGNMIWRTVDGSITWERLPLPEGGVITSPFSESHPMI